MQLSRESALLVVCPEVDRHVRTERSRLDKAAQDGIPSHFTVIYPFKPLEHMTAADHRRLEELTQAHETFSIRLGRTGWFGRDVLFLAPDDPDPISQLIRRVGTAFPDHPPYGGQYAEPVPHLTVGHGHPVTELELAERSVSRELPLIEQVDHIELWAGAAVEGRVRPARWQHVRDYQLSADTVPS